MKQALTGVRILDLTHMLSENTSSEKQQVQ